MMNKRNLSMSIMFKNRKISTAISIPKTSPSIWIPSKNISKCYKCKSVFSIINRKNIIVECVVEYFVIIALINGVLYLV